MDDINQEGFDQLLSWLNPDREQAAERYEWIRKRLSKIFVSRGSPVPDDLADATINRVAKKLPEIRLTYQGDPAHYFYKVSSFIWLEQGRKDRLPAVVPVHPKYDEADERDLRCLETCLNKLPAADRQLVVAYYQEEKQAKIEHRKKLADQLGLALNALRIRACRIRAQLFECVQLCREEAPA